MCKEILKHACKLSSGNKRVKCGLIIHCFVLLTLFSLYNILLTSIQLQIYNSMINRDLINRIWKQE